MSPTIYHSLNLLIVVIAVVVGAWRIFQLHRTQATYNGRLLPFAYYSLGAVFVWGLQGVLFLVKPISVTNGWIVNFGLLLGVIQNALWLTAVVPLYSKRSLRISQTLPVFIAFSTAIAAVSCWTGVLSSTLFDKIEGVSGFLIFVAITYSFVKLRLSSLSAGAFFVYGYFQWIGRFLWLKSFADIHLLQLLSFPVLRFLLLFFWIRAISEMGQDPVPLHEEAVRKVKSELSDLLNPPKVMISSTILDLRQERDAAARAISGLGFNPLRSETFGSTSYPPREICQLLAEECRIFILIIGERYGTEIEPEGISVTELELQIALAQNPRKVLLYVKDEVPLREAKLEEFLKRIEHFNVGYFETLFKTPEELYVQIQQDIARWLAAKVG